MSCAVLSQSSLSPAGRHRLRAGQDICLFLPFLNCKPALVLPVDLTNAPALFLCPSYGETQTRFINKSQLTHRCRIERESEISPGTVPPTPPPKDPTHMPRKNSDWSRANDFRDYRKELAVLETSGHRIPSISRNPPTATSPVMSWSSPSSIMPQSVLFHSFYNDSNEDVAQLSPGFARPGSGRDEAVGFPSDDRRPSVTTVSSQSSSLGSRFHKPLQRFFGEEYPGDSRQNSDTSLTTPYAIDTQSARPGRNRNNSVNNPIGGTIGVHSRPGSPISSRPRTPLPSSEVTPWEFQDVKVSWSLVWLHMAGGTSWGLERPSFPHRSFHALLMPSPSSFQHPRRTCDKLLISTV